MIHDKYARLSPEIREVVDQAYDAAAAALYGSDRPLRAMGDDRAERLVEAIAVFVVECNPELMEPING